MIISAAQLKAFDFYLLRVPLLPYDRLEALHTQSIKSIFEDPLLQEAIYLASQDLHTTLLQWIAGTISLRPAKEHKLVISLYKYLLRMCTRCTPYGLFAGSATGTVTETPSRIRLDTTHRLQRAARLDMSYLSGITDTLMNDEALTEAMTFRMNSSLYNAGKTYRYYEYRLDKGKRKYFLSTFTHTPYLEQVMRLARNGARLDTLVAGLTDKGIEEIEARAFIRLLIQNQVLVSAWQPTITGTDHLGRLIRELEQSPAGAGPADRLREVRQLLQAPGLDTDGHAAIKQLIESTFPGVEGTDHIGMNLFYPTLVNAISKNTMGLLTGLLGRLLCLNQGGVPDSLLQFRQQFCDRYEEREIPLMTVLDSENGIGYGLMTGDKSSYTPFVDDLVLPGTTTRQPLSWDPYHRLLLEKFVAAQKDGSHAIELTEADLDQLVPDKKDTPLPATTPVLGTLLAGSADQLDNGDFRFVLKSFGGPGAMTLLGRFAADNEALEQKLQACMQQEKKAFAGCILAEIVHLPEGRSGNVLLRPRLGDFEIPFLGTSCAGKDFQLPVDDLYLSVRGNRVILRSRRLGKEIIPRLSSAHNYSGGLAIYRFLCDLQHQYGSLNVQWDWSFLEEQPFLPRVSYRQIILKRARWRLPAGSYGENLDAILTKHHIPGKVILAEGDNELLLDLSCSYAREILADRLEKGDAILFESLETENNRLVSGPMGFHCNELIIPLYTDDLSRQLLEATTLPEPRMRIGDNSWPGQLTGFRRSFAPGSEWLYVKIYCGTKWMDRLLTNELSMLTDELQEEGLTTCWFFVRYHDSGNHLRLRFRNPAGTGAAHKVLDRLYTFFAGYIEDDIIQKIQVDTYVRELERYGAAMELSEEFFFHDSEAVMRMLPYLTGEGHEEIRWLAALKGVDHLLDDFGYDTERKEQLLQRLQHSFFVEFNGDRHLINQLNQKYRDDSRMIVRLLEAGSDPSPLPAPVLEILQVRSIRTRPIIERLRRPPADYIHLFLNRLFVANQRMHELVIYHYLLKYYTSALAREKLQNTGKVLL